MTSYTIHVGYNSSRDNVEVAERMLAALEYLQDHPQRIAVEALRVEPYLNINTLTDYAESYRKPVTDLTVVVQPDKERNNLPTIYQAASGGEPGRSAKEALRRAVCRLVMEYCHRNGMEVSISVG